MNIGSSYKQFFQKAGEYYGGDRAEILEFVSPQIKTSLEFGCGQGGFSELIKKRLKAETWAVELHEGMAKLAESKLDKVINKDATKALIDLPDKYFDSIFFLDILEHLVDPYSLLEDCKKKLTDEGAVIASIPNIRYYRALKNYVFKGMWEYKDQGIMDITHLRFFTHSSLVKMFKELGYKDVVITGIHETKSNGFKLLNTIFFNKFWDSRYKHWIVVAKKS